MPSMSASCSLYHSATCCRLARSSSIRDSCASAQCRAQLVEPIVIAEPPVRQPGVEDIAALIPERSEERVPVEAIGDEHPPFAGRHLLVRVEREHTDIAEGSRSPSFVLRADRFAGVFDDEQTVLTSDLIDRFHIGGLAERVNRKDGFELLRRG